MRRSPRPTRRNQLSIPIAIPAGCLALAGALMVFIGVYFVALRPPLLPEDIRYLHADLNLLTQAAPELTGWLRWVFRVLGGYIAATGVLTMHLALTSFRERSRWAFAVAALAGGMSIGVMASVNFMIGSDFRWPLFALACLWGLALALRLIARS